MKTDAQDFALLASAVEASARGLVDHPSRVRLEWSSGPAGLVLGLETAPSDLGQLLGREGRHALALRALIAGVAGRLRKRLELAIVEPTRIGARTEVPPAEALEVSDPGALQGLLEQWVRLLVDTPEAVRVELRTGQRAALLSIHVHPDEHRQVVGRFGSLIGALRTLLEPMAARHGWKALIEVVEPRFASPRSSTTAAAMSW